MGVLHRRAAALGVLGVLGALAAAATAQPAPHPLSDVCTFSADLSEVQSCVPTQFVGSVYLPLSVASIRPHALAGLRINGA